jgi:hypothetical protein
MLIIIGEAGKSKTIDALIKAKKIDGKALTGKNENTSFRISAIHFRRF